jgi:ergothioneine biosynthesis protein EgtB
MSIDPQTRARARSPRDAGVRSSRDLAALFERVRRRTEALCDGLSPEDCSAQSMPDASPIKWHLAHTSWFFETFVLAPNDARHRAFHPEFSYLFNSYYNAVGERVARPQRGLITRPSLEEVMAYRRHVDERVQELIDADRIVDPAVLELGCHHEQQHQELVLTDLKHLFWLNPLRPAFRARIERSAPALPLRFVGFGEGLRWIGHDVDGFAFDNESPRHRAFVDAFALASRPSTNGEYLDFIADGGYARAELWLSDGWDAVSASGWCAPLYWENRGDRWLSFTLAGMREIDPNEPVCHVSYYEADAFARWSRARLARETEWETAASEIPIDGNFAESERFHPRGAPRTTTTRNGSSASSSSIRDGSSTTTREDSSASLQSMFGDVWEWTQSAYSAYPRYAPAAGALGEYNGKFMCNQLVLRGGSCASPRSHLRATYRNFFPPTTRWQFSGIRLARDL